MDDYIECEIEESYFLIYQDGSYAEFVCELDMKVYEAHASGNGDFNNHKIVFLKKGEIMYSELIKFSTEELREKIAFGEQAGGPYGIKLVEMCTDVLNHRALKGGEDVS